MKQVLIAVVALVAVALPAAAFDHHVTMQPIQVRNDAGTLDPAQGQYPAAPIPVEATNKIFAQAGVDVTVLPIVYLDATDHLVIDDSAEFQALTLTPGHGQHPDPLVLNMWMVQSAAPAAVQLAWIGGNGVAVNGQYVGYGLFMVAHGLGHNLGLPTLPGTVDPNNLMLEAPLLPSSLADIYPDGRGRCHLIAAQIATILTSPFVVYQDLTPPAAPVLAVVEDEFGRRIDWQNPPDPDFDHTCLCRGLEPGFTEGDTVYCGTGTSYQETELLRYWYRARAYDVHGNASAWSNEVVGQYPTGAPGAQVASLRLHRNQPNPFNPLTTLRFEVPAAGRVRLEVYDAAGRLVRVLLDADLPAGGHQAVWDGRNAAGQAVASGSYLARLQACGSLWAVRMSLVR
jgi:hypothetical protein